MGFPHVLGIKYPGEYIYNMAVCQNLVPLVNIKIAGKWMFIPLKMVLIGIDPYPYISAQLFASRQTGRWSWVFTFR